MKNKVTLKKILIIFYILASSGLHAQEEKFPFYFFKMLPYSLENPKSAKDASVDLCKIVAKDCKLPDLAELKIPEWHCENTVPCPVEDFLKYVVNPLYESTSKTSRVSGAIVNAVYNRCSNNWKKDSHCKTSASLSFIVNLKGERKNFNHYSVADEDYMKGDFRHRHTGGMDNGFSDYLRVMDAVPSKSSEEMTDHWYAFANPDESGGKLWFNHKSNLLTPKYLSLFYPKEFFVDIKQNSPVGLVTEGGTIDSVFILDYSSDNIILSTVNITNKAYGYFYDVGYKAPSLREKDYQKKNPPPVITFEGVPTHKIDIDKIYVNGFFVKGVWIYEPDFPNVFLLQDYIEKSRKSYEASKKGKSTK